jgi:GH15 family glucan-1,4-alpha-glucosidase
VLSYCPSHHAPGPWLDAEKALRDTEAAWRAWSDRCASAGGLTEVVKQSLLVLKGLTYAPTGGIVAAPTTSLPEQAGGVRNWDYRYCWLRDATFTLLALGGAGYAEEARAWRDWLMRAVAGSPEQMQIMYGIGGERRLPEWEATWLPGFETASPVRIGNAAASQLQLDVYGEVADAMFQARVQGMPPSGRSRAIGRALIDYLESNWEQPDEGIWEVRGPRQHFTHSKVMAWVGVDRYLRLKDAPQPRGGQLETLRDRIHTMICRDGFDGVRNSFMQTLDPPRVLDASLLLLPLVGFLPINDPRIAGTIAAVESELVEGGLVRRWSRAGGPNEGAFIACTCWLADCLVMQGRRQEARVYLQRVIDTANDVGLLSEQWDTGAGRMLGNFPQALSHLALINAALGLHDAGSRRGVDRVTGGSAGQ